MEHEGVGSEHVTVFAHELQPASVDLVGEPVAGQPPVRGEHELIGDGAAFDDGERGNGG